VINFNQFTLSARFSGPVFGARLVQMPEGDTEQALAQLSAGFQPCLRRMVVLILACFLKETGPAAKKNVDTHETNRPGNGSMITTCLDQNL